MYTQLNNYNYLTRSYTRCMNYFHLLFCLLSPPRLLSAIRRACLKFCTIWKTGVKFNVTAYCALWANPCSAKNKNQKHYMPFFWDICPSKKKYPKAPTRKRVKRDMARGRQWQRIYEYSSSNQTIYWWLNANFNLNPLPCGCDVFTLQHI